MCGNEPGTVVDLTLGIPGPAEPLLDGDREIGEPSLVNDDTIDDVDDDDDVAVRGDN